jgi:capsular polysaccharide biosynthesis protein
MTEYVPVDEPLDGPDAEPQPVRRELGQFVSLHYVFKAISRRRRVVLVMALIGLLVGMSLHVIVPRKYSATSTIFMTFNPQDDPARDMATSVALLDSDAVAQNVIAQLKLDVTPQKFEEQYSGTAVTDSLLEITVEAPTAADAVKRATVIDSQFLAFRTNMLNRQNTDDNAGDYAEIAALQKQSSGATSAVVLQDQNLIAALDAAIQTNDETNTLIKNGTYVVAQPTAITHSALKVLLADSGSGLVAGLALGLGAIIVLAVASDRIRQRDEFAAALGSPVELSVGRFGRCRVLRKRRLRRKLSRPGRPVELMARYLRQVVHSGPTPKRLAVVSIDSLEPSALSLAILAGRLAVFEGKRVMVTDMSPGRVLGELLGVSKPETRIVFVKGAWVPVLVSVPPEDDPTVEMPLPELDAEALPGQQWSSPHVMLSLTTVDPATGAEHLRQVADEAVVVVTAGRANATRVRSTAQLLRAAGVKVRSAILVATDRNDDSLGLRRDDLGSREDDQDLENLMHPEFVSAGSAENR